MKKLKLKKKYKKIIINLVIMIAGGLLLVGIIGIYCQKSDEIRNGKIENEMRER